jgi:hypothetical protein
VPDSRYAPPKSEVADVRTTASKRWARATWVHFLVFAGLALLALAEVKVVAHALRTASGWCFVAVVVLTAGMLYFPARSLRALSEAAPPLWTDVLGPAVFVSLFFIGIEVEDVNLAVLGGAPAFLANGIVGILVMLTERRHGLRVYVSGRRYVFSGKSAL